MSRRPTDAEIAFLSSHRVGRLATAGTDGQPSVVPFCYAVVETAEGQAIVSALDEKPKTVTVTELRRVKDILANPQVSLVVDDYTDDWANLAFVQVSGRARLVDPGAERFDIAIDLLRAKYPQYLSMVIEERPLIWIEIERVKSWRGGADTAARPAGLTAIIEGRRSVRALLPVLVPRDVIQRAITAAGWAPSPHGRQPWRFAVVESPARKAQLISSMEVEWRRQLHFDGQDETVVQIRLAKSRTRILEAPIIVVPCLYLEDLDDYPDAARTAAERTMAVQSLGAAIQNFMLSIYAEGLDSGWMCAPLFCPEVVRDALGLDRALIPQALLPVGYSAKDPVRRPHLPTERLIVDWS